MTRVKTKAKRRKKPAEPSRAEASLRKHLVWKGVMESEDDLQALHDWLKKLGKARSAWETSIMERLAEELGI